jgi:hypothetical protein
MTTHLPSPAPSPKHLGNTTLVGAVIALSFALASCGGGGGGSPAPVPVPPPAVIGGDMSVTLSALPATAAPNSVFNGTLTCTNVSASTAAASVSCSASASAPLGATVVVGSCAYSAGSSASSVLPLGTITCPLNFGMPGLVGGTDTAQSTVGITASTGSTADSNAANNSLSLTINMIDAINDSATTSFGIATSVNVLSNDTIGSTTASTGNATLTVITAATAGSSFDAATGNYSVPATAAQGTYSVTYQICSNPASSPAACDTATASIVVGPPAPVTVAISGVATAEIVPNNLATGALNYAGVTAQPIKGVVVEMLNAANSAVLGTTSTDATGAYTISNIPSNTNVILRVRARLLNATKWDVTVKDNTQSDAPYVLDTAAFSSGSVATLTKNVLATSGWSGTSYASARTSGPFAITNTIYNAIQKVLTASPNQNFPALSVFWSVNNVSASPQNIPLGQISTTYFSYNGTSRSIYVLGKENNDTDEFDETVIAHEYGHYFQNAFSRDDSLGGQHGRGNYLDMRVAFSEGWGNGWSGIATNRSVYTDSSGTSQSRGGVNNLAAPVAAANTPGWYKEDTVQYLIYTFNANYGFTPIWQAMVAPSFISGAAATSIHAFASSLKAVSPANAAAIDSLLAGQNIIAANAFGTTETNNGGLTGTGTAYAALPLYKPFNGSSGTFCLNLVNAPATGDFNKLGASQYLRFTSVAGVKTVTITGGTDPDFEVYQAGLGFIGQGFSGIAGSETKSINFPAAADTVLIFNEADPAGAAAAAGNTTPCYTVTIN